MDKQIFDEYGNYKFPTEEKQDGVNTVNQIEEMVITTYPIYATMEDSLRKEAIECMNSYTVFERLYNAGYRKIPENAVVLTKEEYDELKKGVKTHNYTAMFDAQDAYRWEQGYFQGFKETAEKFAERLKQPPYKDFTEEWVADEILKEITEGK